MLTLSVDDLLTTGDHTERIASLKPALNKEFAININGELKECQWDDHVESFLGINVTGRTEDGFIQLSVPVQDMKKLSKLMVAMRVHMVNIIKYGPRAGMESESKLTEAVACLSDAELSEPDNKYR